MPCSSSAAALLSSAASASSSSPPFLRLPAALTNSLRLRSRPSSSALLRFCEIFAFSVALRYSLPAVFRVMGDGVSWRGVDDFTASNRLSGVACSNLGNRGDCRSEQHPESCFVRDSKRCGSPVAAAGLDQARFLGNGEWDTSEKLADSVLNLSKFHGSKASSEVVEGAPKPTSGLPDRAQSQVQRMGGERFKLTESCLLVLRLGDITEWFVDGETDAIVNAANRAMLGGGGVDGAIHRAAGPELYEACLEVPEKAKNVRCQTGEAVITKGFRLPVSRIIHTVGPIYKDQISSASLLQRAYKSSLALAIENKIKYIAFPAISCGVYGYPYDEGADVALKTVKENANSLHEVHFVLFEKGTWAEWLSKANECFEKI